MTTNWNQLREDRELTYFRADVCLGSPQSFTLEEKRQICGQMEASTAEIDSALKKDFESLPPEAQGMLLDMLCASGCVRAVGRQRQLDAMTYWCRITSNPLMPSPNQRLPRSSRP